MGKNRKHLRCKPTLVKRILGESNSKDNKSKGYYQCRLNLSNILESIPMTINQEDIQVEATFLNGNLNIAIYCNELIGTPDNPSGGVYAEEDEQQ
jgi:hypothetical protein